MRRREFIRLIGGAAVAWPLAARAQQPEKIAKIGYPDLGPASARVDRVEALRAGLRDLGYIEGKNIAIEFRWAERAEQFPELATDLVRRKVDVIFAISSTMVEPARKATSTIPIVFATHADPVGIGHVVSSQADEDFDGAFAIMARERLEALMVVASPLFITHRQRLAELAREHRLPAMFGSKENVQAGGLISYSADLTDLHRRAASYIDKILRGAKPDELPVEQASKYEMVINLKTAKALGITIPASLLARADEVIE